jgi:hypothetical protein
MSDDKQRPKDEVEEAGEESFPASDPPAYSSGSATPGEDDGERSPGHLDREEDGERSDRDA